MTVNQALFYDEVKSYFDDTAEPSIEGDAEEFERSAKNLQIMKKIALSILRLLKESYKLSMKRIR